jgi:hypothetical protein
MKLATWNVNSLKVRLPQLLAWLAIEQPDVICLQETKLEDSRFPRQEIESAGYHVSFSGQKTYNGVALLARERPTDIVFGNPFYLDPQKRLLAATVGDLCVVCAYVPMVSPSAATSMPTNSPGSMASPTGSLTASRTIRSWFWPAISISHRRIATSTTPSPGPAKSSARSLNGQLSRVC